jgi:hypothetical protein
MGLRLTSGKIFLASDKILFYFFSLSILSDGFFGSGGRMTPWSSFFEALDGAFIASLADRPHEDVEIIQEIGALSLKLF